MKRKFICIFTALSVVVILSIITKKEKEIEITHLMLSNIEALSSAENFVPITCRGMCSTKCNIYESYSRQIIYYSIDKEYDKY